MNLPDLEALALFAKVAEAGAFARAARELGISKATLSKAVTRLETRLGTRLFHRTSRQLSLTEAGRGVLAGAREMLAAGEAAEAQAMDDAAAPRGQIRLAGPMSFGLAYLAPALPDFLAQYPDVTVDLHLSDAMVDLVGGGFDVAMRIGALADSSLIARRLCDVPRYVVAAPAYLARRGAPAHPRDLSGHDCLTYSYLATPDIWRFTGPGGEEAAARPGMRMRANNADALMPALISGLGLALQPDFVVWHHLRDGRLKAVLEDWAAPPISLNLVTPPGGQRPARVSALIEFLVRRFADAPWRGRKAA